MSSATRILLIDPRAKMRSAWLAAAEKDVKKFYATE